MNDPRNELAAWMKFYDDQKMGPQGSHPFGYGAFGGGGGPVDDGSGRAAWAMKMMGGQQQGQQAPNFWSGNASNPGQQQPNPAYVQPQPFHQPPEGRPIQQISRDAGFPMAPGQQDQGIAMPDWGIRSNIKNYLKQMLGR